MFHQEKQMSLARQTGHDSGHPRIHVRKLRIAVAAAAALASASGFAQQEPIEEVLVLGNSRTFSEATTTASMQAQQSPITTVLATIDNLPGVNVTEGDTFGFDDWSTTINLRGYQSNLSEQQVGITIDGLPNGESGYGGGAKANRFIDSANSGGVEVNQGTADISSRTLEALGGTLNFLTDNPLDTERFRTQVATGDFNSQRYYGRYDTGRILDDTTRAWLSVSHQEATDWMEGSAQNERDHMAGKFITTLNGMEFTGYFSWDDIQEDNYQRITRSEFDVNPNWDRLTGGWTAIPYVDQLYRRAWSTLRENKFAYLKASFDVNENLEVRAGTYIHNMTGRGDWIPPNLINIRNDGTGPESELVPGTTTLGGSPLGSIYFVDGSGKSLSPIAGCQSSITFPYGGAGPEYDPACYPAGAIPVSSYRHTHYHRDRWGLTLDAEYTLEMGGDSENIIRGGVWYDDSTRYEYRDWHKVTDSRTGAQFDNPAYWRQYDLEYPRETMNWYLADTFTSGIFSVSLGLRQFDIDTSRVDNFRVDPTVYLSEKTDTVYSTGLTMQMPVDGLEAFAGFSQNVKPLTDGILRNAVVSVSNLEAETADNVEVGLRYANRGVAASAVWFDNKFNNRLEFFGPQVAGNIPNYLIGTDGRYDNVGGIESSGLELAVAFDLAENWSVYSSYTYTDATYVGTGLGAGADAAVGVTPGNTVVGTPETMFVVTLDWTRGNYSAGLSSKYVDDRYIDRANTSVADGYATTDFYFNINGDAVGDLLSGIQLGLVVNNLTDKSYQGGISGFGTWIGAPRTAVFTLTADF
jgi:iron complex outermembrane receptor protein